MDDFVNLLPFDGWADLTQRRLLALAVGEFYAFTLVLARMSGLMTVGPLFGQPIVPANIRVLLVILLSLLITPTLRGRAQAAFTAMDANRDGWLTRSEIPEPLGPRFDRLLAKTGQPADGAVSRAQFAARPAIPTGLLDYAWIAVMEFALGGVLGLGVMTVLSGLQLAGQLIDQQTGIALGDVFNPGLDIQASLSGQLLFLLGTTVLLIMEPVNGHLLMMGALIDTFQTLPPAEAYVSLTAVELLRDLVHQSLVLAVQIAAPVLAMMSLVALAMGFLGHTVPQVNLLVVGFPVRAMISILILTVSISGAARAVVDVVPRTIDELRFALADAPPTTFVK